jgi:hypothetical protein
VEGRRREVDRVEGGRLERWWKGRRGGWKVEGCRDGGRGGRGIGIGRGGGGRRKGAGDGGGGRER